MRPGEYLTVVLHQTRSPENMGAVARVMANFGFSRLILSDPVITSFRGAERLAVKSEHLLEAMTVVRDLPEALTDCVYAVGTTSRTQLEGRSALTPEEAVRRLAEESRRGRVALVFGGEQRGMSDEELARCEDVLAIPTCDVQPSMNLAQSAAVLMYLCHRQGLELPAEPAPEPGARLGTLNALGQRMREVLLQADFLNPEAPHHVLNELNLSLMRAKLTQREAELWLNAFKHLGRAVARDAAR
ncbi:RNA methyltransferase [Corallococcus sp. H22C18031201]|uniref:RNA methyltransferase n=1 Tax=Citreicoccus inhibens TaxID=2849499 RepID=UPI000E715255|nr:RNA methyltransferase [Citreicoccus inhibens]MBU8897682.1 RNA methyltransferase [Citreicoccus inhibens]RJS27455.1 RNA methyltransferase [Corallococcus sp. H22C18031201]